MAKGFFEGERGRAFLDGGVGKYVFEFDEKGRFDFAKIFLQLLEGHVGRVLLWGIDAPAGSVGVVVGAFMDGVVIDEYLCAAGSVAGLHFILLS